MQNGESALGMPPKDALAFEVGRLKTERSKIELVKAAKLMSEQQVDEAVVDLQEIQRQVAERGQ